MSRLWEQFWAWWWERRTMTTEELQARIAADVPPADADRFLPAALRRHPLARAIS